jgi:hypothetical protein
VGENLLARFFPRSGESRDEVLSAEASGLSMVAAIVGTVKIGNAERDGRRVIESVSVG